MSKAQNKQYQKENENRSQSIKKAGKKKEGLKGLTIQSLENREERLRHKLEYSKSKIFDYKMSLIKIEFDLKHPVRGMDETLIKKKATIEHNLKAHEKRTEDFWKLLDDVAKERKRRTIKPKESSKFKFW